MLTVRQVEAEKPDGVALECVDGEKVVGRLTATAHLDGSLMVKPIDTAQREAARSLLAVLERDAVAQRVPAIYLECRDEAEKNLYLPAGYSELPGGGTVLVKKLPLL